MRNLIEYPIDRDDVKHLVHSIVHSDNVGDLRPLALVELLLMFMREAELSVGDDEDNRNLVLEFLGGLGY